MRRDRRDDRVVAGTPAADLLGAPAAATSSVNGAVQRKAISDTTPQERQQQHDKADLASLLGLEAEMALGAKRLQAAAFEILRMVATPFGEGGIDPVLQALRARIDKATAELQLLNHHVDVRGTRGMTSESVQLAPQLATLNQALAHFEHAVQQATEYAIKHYDGNRFEASPARKQLQTLYDKLGLARTRIQYRDVDPRPPGVMQEEAFRKNLTAAYEAAHSVRMSLTKGSEADVEGDLWKMVRHIGAIATLLKQDGGAATMKRHKPRLQQILVEVQDVENEIATRPALAGALATSSFPADTRDMVNAITGSRTGDEYEPRPRWRSQTSSVLKSQ